MQTEEKETLLSSLKKKQIKMEQVLLKPRVHQQQTRTTQNVRVGTQQAQVRTAHPVQAPVMVTPTRSQDVLQGRKF